MQDNNNFTDLSGILLPVDQYTGHLKSIKELFEDRLSLYNITQRQAENILGVQARTLDGILNKSTVRVDALNILKLSQFLGIAESDFYKIYINELTQEAIRELEDTRRNTFIAANFDVATLRKCGFLPKKSDFPEIENRIKKFFGLSSIYDYRTRSRYIPAFSKTKRTPHILMREFWVASAIDQFEKLNNHNEYARDALIDLLPKIRPYTMNVEQGFKTVVRALYNIGVTVIYQEHLPTTQVRGATFVVKNKPCIAVTDLNKNYSTLWFALLHELHHVLFDYEDIEKQVFHMTGEPDLFLLQEDAADDFAREYLFPTDRLKYILPHIDNEFLVSSYAKESQVHRCIVYSFYHRYMSERGGNYWGRFKEHFPDISLALKSLRDGDPYQYEEIQESVNYLKEKVYNI
jgi:HTH-type transcriptional regulator/antitoxin HigA